MNKASRRSTRARELQAHKLAEEIIEIANTPVIGQKTVSKATGLETTECDMIEHRRLQVDARKWYLSKVLPKVYGDKLDLNHSGGVTVRVKDYTGRKKEEGDDA